MRSWPFYIWLKRLAPFALAFLIWFGWRHASDYRENLRLEGERKMAIVTARLWIASARFRDSSEVYLAYRDSLLGAHDLHLEQFQAYANRYSEEPEKFEQFTGLVSTMVDSLYQSERLLYQSVDTLESYPDKIPDSAATGAR
jgi:hypothetical protein